jgi:hypothetical protein
MRSRAFALAIPAAIAITLVATTPAVAAGPTAIDLGTASSFAVLGASAVTNTGGSVLNGDLGLSPDTLLKGFPPGTLNGGLHYTDAVAAGAQSDLTTAYVIAANLTPATTVGLSDLNGMTLVGGIYSGGALSLPVGGEVTLDGGGDPSSVWVFQAASSLVANSGSSVTLINGANACNIFWQVTSSATIGTNADFVGTVMALTSIQAQTGATINGRLLARNGAVTLDDNLITSSGCTPVTATGTLPAGVTVTTTGSTTTGIYGPDAETLIAAPPGGGGGGAAGGGTSIAALAETGVSDQLGYLGLGLLLIGGALVFTARAERRKAHRAA